MAYLKDLQRLCMECEKRPATVELVSRQNASHGVFCKVCGERRLKNLLTSEERESHLRGAGL